MGTGYRVVEIATGRRGYMGPVIALTGPSMDVRFIEWDDGARSWYRYGDDAIRIEQ